VADVCDDCGGPLVTRPDDTPEATRTRLLDYQEQTRPILERLARKHTVVTVDGSATPDVVRADIRRMLRLPSAPAVTQPSREAPRGADAMSARAT
jgi:adenylate kinase